MYSNPPCFNFSLSLQKSLTTSCSSWPSPYLLLPGCRVLSIFVLYGKAGAHPSLLLESTRARHLHGPATGLLVKDGLQQGVVVGVIAEAVVRLLLGPAGLVAGALGVGRGRAFWKSLKGVKVRFINAGGWSILGASWLLLR